MDKKKSKWVILKEMWKDPKKHAIICLCLYAIFFLGIFIMFKVMSITSSIKNENKETHELTELEMYKDMNNYEYNYNISLNGNTYYIEGTVYLNKEKFELKNNNTSFYITDNNQEYDNDYLNLEDSINLNLEMIKPNNIYLILKDLNPTSTTEYKDMTKKEVYNLKLDRIKDILRNTYNNYEENIVINIYSQNKEINKIEIDINTQELTETIEIEYLNIGNIKDFNINS